MIVSKEMKEGDIVVYFPVETAICEKYLSANNLYEIGQFEKNGNAEDVKKILAESEALPDNDTEGKLACLNKAMLREYDIVVDNMNLNPKEEAYFRAIIDKFNSSNLLDYTYELEFKDFLDITPEECIERDAKREGSNRIGKDVIMETYNRYKDRITELREKKK